MSLSTPTIKTFITTSGWPKSTFCPRTIYTIQPCPTDTRVNSPFLSAKPTWKRKCPNLSWRTHITAHTPPNNARSEGPGAPPNFTKPSRRVTSSRRSTKSTTSRPINAKRGSLPSTSTLGSRLSKNRPATPHGPTPPPTKLCTCGNTSREKVSTSMPTSSSRTLKGRPLPNSC